MKVLTKKTIKRIYNIVVVMALVLAVVYISMKFIHVGNVEYTNNAQVYRHITPIATRVGGFIREIRFTDFQEVHRGDTLIIIEDAEYRLQLSQAESNAKGSAASESAVWAEINTTGSNIEVASASIEEARVEMENARADLARYENLLATGAVTQQQYDNIKTRYSVALSRFNQASSVRNSTSLTREQQRHQLSRSQSQAAAADDAVALARLNLSYTVITATCDGKIGRKGVLEGQLVEVGQTLAEIVDNDNVWVIANYRESQMANIRIGEEVVITADAIPNKTFRGEVEIIAGATGAAFSHTPTDNATGNFVKVEQRIPIRIALSEENDKDDLARLLAGMNVETEIRY